MKSKKRSRNVSREPYETSSFLSDDVQSMVVLGLAVSSLGLAFYSITGGPVSNYLAKTQPIVANAQEEPESDHLELSDIVDEGQYDVVIDVDEDGRRSYILTPKDDNDNDDEESTSSDDDKEKEKSDKDKEDDSKNKDKDDESKDSDSETEEDESDEDSSDSHLSKEAQEKLEEHKSNRLRIQPDRDGLDIYYYVVESGDSLDMIADTFDVPVGQLMEENHIENADVIYVGEIIFMPTDFIK